MLDTVEETTSEKPAPKSIMGGTGRRKRPLRNVRWAISALQVRKNKAPYNDIIATKLNGRVFKSHVPDVSLLQGLRKSSSVDKTHEEFISAARDGMLDMVVCHLELASHNYIHMFDEDGYTALHHAARYNRAKVAEALISAGANVNIKGGHDEVTPLHLACRYDSGSVTQTLLIRGADINAKDLKGRTPLHYATRRGHDTVTKMLLSVSTCDVNVADADLITPLIMAAMDGNAHICEILLTRGAMLAQQDINDMTPLMWAASENHIRVVALFLKAAQKMGTEALRQYVKAADNEGNTALHLAVQNLASEICEMLLNNYADVDAAKYNLATSLHMAACNGDLEIAKLLISHGAQVNTRDIEQMTPVHKAALYNKVDMIKLLMKHGADINAKDKKNMMPLHHACWKGQTQTAEFLLDNGAQIAESDSSLKTALHWAVQFGHYETMLALLKFGANSTLEASDKNDQTVLHYAAYFGNVSVLSTLLEAGSSPDAKDQEERRPLHIAAQYDNVSCVEALINVSQHETNDDDVDGRTPLLLACTHGHHQVVQVLLSLGADVSKRDDEHRTSLMLAAAHGHTFVMKILLDNQANVNDSDKNKNTALHYACGGGHIEALQLLLEKRADVTVKNTHNAAPLDLAIDNMHTEVANVMLRSRSWRECLSVRDAKGATVMDRLIEKMPDVAQIVLDHCVERSTRDDDDPTLNMVFDYQYIDPGPDEMAPKQTNRYFALNTMVEYERDSLLSHPLCQNILSQKWVRYGRRTFYLNLFIYIGYLVSLNLYVSEVDDAITAQYVDKVHKCPITLSDTELKNVSLVDDYIEAKRMLVREDMSTIAQVSRICCMVFVSMIAVKEVFKIYSQRIRYVFNFFNLIAWILLGATFAFCLGGNKSPCLPQWRAGWIAMFFAWINFIMYLRRIDFVGIYVIMFVTVLVSLMKAILLFLFFSWAFASAFYIVMSGKKSLPEGAACGDEDEKCHFHPIKHSLLNVFIMSLGEIDKVKDWLAQTPHDMFYLDTYILLCTFLFLMPIVLMNLLIGIAVGDIEKVQHNAYLKRIALQVDLLYQIENNMPKFMQRKVFVRRATIKPNEGKFSKLDKIHREVFGSSKNVQFIQAEQKDKTHFKLDRLKDEFFQAQSKIRSMQATLQQQHNLLQQIANKMDIQEIGYTPQDLNIPYADDTSLSVYDNLSVPGGRTPLRGRYKSIRMQGHERPQSVII